MVHRNNYILRVLIYLFVIFILISGVLVGAARAFTPILNQYRSQIIEFVSKTVHLSINFDTVSGSWHWLQPMLKFKNVTISQPNASLPSLQIQEFDLGINLVKSLFHWQLEPGTLFARETSLTVTQQNNGQWSLSGFNYAASPSSNIENVVASLFAVDRIGIKNVNIRLEPYHALPLNINNINVNLLGFGKRHFLEGNFTVAYQGKKEVPIELSARFEGDATDLDTLSTRFHLAIKDISLTDWLSVFPVEKIVLSGTIPTLSLDGWAHGLNMTQFNLKFAGSNLHIQYGEMKKSFPIDFISANLYANHPAKKKWQFSLKHWQLEHDGIMLPENKAALDWEFENKNNFILKGWIDHLSLQSLAPLWHLHDIRSSVVSNMMIKMQPQGMLQHLTWSASQKTSGSLAYSLETQLNDVSFQPWEKVPGITHINGQLHLNQQGGGAVLEGTNTVTTFPLVFREPLTATNWYSDMGWQLQDKGLLIESTDTHFTTLSGSAKGRLSLYFPYNTDSSVIDLSSTVSINQLSRQDIYRYLPTGILTKPVIEWLDDNLIDIGKGEASLTLKGALRDFPFDDGQGEFTIRAQINKGRLRLSEGWPIASNLVASLLFSDRSMDIQVSSGEVDGATIAKARAQIPYMGLYKPVILTVTGQGQGDTSQALAFLHQSPLKIYLKQGLDTLQGSGAVQVNLSLEIPLTDTEKLQPKVQGNVVLHEVGLTLPALSTEIESLNGQLHFSQDGLSSPGIQGSFLGEPLEVGIIAPSTKNENQTQISLKGTLNLSTLQTQYHFPLNLFATGKTLVKAEVSIASTGSIRFIAQSLLQGINIDLPLSLKKTSQQAVPLNIKGSLDAVLPSQAGFTFGKQAAGSAQFILSPKFKLQSGNLILGSDVLKSPLSNGFSLTAMMPVCSSVVWKNTVLQLKPLMGQSTLVSNGWPAWLNEVNLNCSQLRVSNFLLTNAIIALNPSSTGFAIKIQSAEAQGVISVPRSKAKQPLQINFQHLKLTAGQQQSTVPFQVINPRLLPNMSFIINNFQYNKKNIGNITGNLQTQSNGALITAHISQDNAFNADLKAQWQISPNVMTILTGSLSSKNTAQALKNWGFPSNLKSEDASANFALNWKGAPYQLVAANLNGTVNLSINDGLIEGLDKSTDAKVGFGRILTILSLQNLPDTFRSGFSNIGSSGFSFTKINGAFQLENGNAVFKTGSLASRVAGISVSGSLNLVNKTYQMIMIVTPHVTSSVPVAATLVGGPVVGVAVWAANKVLSPALNAITADRYSITGTWKNPVVKKL
ncbi:MAG: TIGR02099 family protein [Legionellales bacterium]|nr:TIGR02099 family protein [Legionellales bacterium]